MSCEVQAGRAGDGNAPAKCNCPNIGACDGSCAPYIGQPGDDLSKIVQTAPAKIYLVIGEDCEPDTDFAELTRSYEDLVTWCADKIDDNSIEYVRADLAAAPAVPAPATDDTRRLDWLAERLLGADWAYGEPATSVWLIETGAAISADLRASIDAAMGVSPSPATESGSQS